ncbi:MAG TPA: hypothetical protein VFD62_16385 [Pyrinomonadaceae bacterium]|jgi:hypothetical protein|nr:hypothetical protein [Pyrinomonadaceae bacterium]
MKEEPTDISEGISIIEDDGETVIIEVSEENYQRDLAAGLDEDEILKPGRHKLRRGGFLARHPELKPRKKSA